MLRAVSSTFTIFLAVVVISSRASRAGEPDVVIPSDSVLARFPIAEGARPLLIPVRYAGKDHFFIADTGACGTVLDTSLPHGKHIGSELIRTSGEMTLANRYEPLAATVGTSPWGFDGAVISMDLRGLREQTGIPIVGILGMDFLGHHVVHLDFDNGELLLLKSAPSGSRRPIPIHWEPGEVPEIVGFVIGSDAVRFQIDTGFLSDVSGSLDAPLIQRLVAQEKLLRLGRVFGETLQGSRACNVFQGRLLALGEFAVSAPIFEASEGESALALGFWSRFTVTFDFPGRKVFLSKSKRYGRPERGNFGGITMVREGSSVVVGCVLKNSPALAAGLRERDVVLKIGNLTANTIGFPELGDLLGRPGKLEFFIRPGCQDLNLIVEIAP